MGIDNPNDHFMRDQYLDMLWKAQRIEDHRLAELILKRLKGVAIEMTVAPVAACEVIPFPGSVGCTKVLCGGSELAYSLWPRRPLRHLLSFMTGYCVVVLFFRFFWH